MKRAFLLLILIGVNACRGDKAKEATTRTNVRDSAAAPVRKAVFPEPEAIGVLRALSDAEIAMARAARETSQNDDILGYAGVMIADHAGLNQLLGATAADNAMSARLRAEGDSVARALAGLTGGFNNTYIEEQVKAHRRALAIVDTVVIPSVRDSRTKDLLTAARPTLEAHLQRAMQILALRRQEAQQRGEPWVSGFATGVPANAQAPTTTPAPTATREPPTAAPAPSPPAKRADTPVVISPPPRPSPPPVPDTVPSTTSNL